MPSWLLGFISFIAVSIIGFGAINFPYVPMLFGVYGAERYNLHGKVIVKLIWLYPLITTVCLYLAWTSNPWLSLAPFAYIVAVWSIRPNKAPATAPSGEFSTKQENVAARMDELNYRWDSWQSLKPENLYVLFTLFSRNKDSADKLKNEIAKTETMYGKVEMTSNPNGTMTVFAPIKIEVIDREVITTLTTKIIDVSWQNQSQLLSLDVMESS